MHASPAYPDGVVFFESWDSYFNAPLLFWSSWREVPIVATDRQFAIGSILSSPLAVGDVGSSAARTATCTRWNSAPVRAKSRQNS